MVILLTGYDWEDAREEAVKAGVDSILSKPLFTDSLTHCVQKILARREKSAEITPDPTTEQDSPVAVAWGRRRPARSVLNGAHWAPEPALNACYWHAAPHLPQLYLSSAIIALGECAITHLILTQPSRKVVLSL